MWANLTRPGVLQKLWFRIDFLNLDIWTHLGRDALCLHQRAPHSLPSTFLSLLSTQFAIFPSPFQDIVYVNFGHYLPIISFTCNLEMLFLPLNYPCYVSEILIKRSEIFTFCDTILLHFCYREKERNCTGLHVKIPVRHKGILIVNHFILQQTSQISTMMNFQNFCFHNLLPHKKLFCQVNDFPHKLIIFNLPSQIFFSPLLFRSFHYTLKIQYLEF